jgi:hypothetical protein
LTAALYAGQGLLESHKSPGTTAAEVATPDHLATQSVRPQGTKVSSTAPEKSNASTAPTTSATGNAAALAPVPHNVHFSAPPCFNYNVQFMNVPGDKEKQTVFPISWDFLSKDTGPNVVVGKMAGTLTLKACLPDTAIQEDTKASKRNGYPIYTVDVNQARLSPSYDPDTFHNGIAWAEKLNTDVEKLKALQADDPTATMADVTRVKALINANIPVVQSLNLLTGLQSVEDHYTKSISDDLFLQWHEAFDRQLTDKGFDINTTQIVPDITKAPKIVFNIKHPDNLKGPFDYETDLAHITDGVIDTVTGKQLIPED